MRAWDPSSGGEGIEEAATGRKPGGANVSGSERNVVLPASQPACYPTAAMQRSLAQGGADAAPQLSVVIPLYNEEANVVPLLDELFAELRRIGRTHEVICVDDGSKDATFARLAEYADREHALRVIRFRLNFGQTAAMSAGIEAAAGELIVPMDGDLQNDPADIEKLLARLGEGYDVVSGWRRDRKDKEFGRKLPSRIANRLISVISGVRLHDYGCSLKAYRREVLRDVKLYGEMHRFIPIYASWQGARVTEMVVNHRARRAGTSKYGLSRTLKVVLDLMVVKFLASYATKPIYVFGGFGLLSWACAGLAAAWAVYFKLTGQKDFVQTPLPLLAVMFTLVGVLSLLMGLLAELVVRTYYESQNKRPYLVAEELNAPPRPSEAQPLRATAN
jgi:glycosyltransferase involved in cell wall biosynthesis